MRSTATHHLEGISWEHVSEANGGQEERSNSHPGSDFMGVRQRSNRRPGGVQQLTAWKGVSQRIKRRPGEAQQLTIWNGFHRCTSANQTEARRSTATHPLEGISWERVSEANGGQEEHCNSHTGRDFMGACQRSKRSQEERSNSHAGRDFMGARQRIRRRPLAVGPQQLTIWKGFRRGK